MPSGSVSRRYQWAGRPSAAGSLPPSFPCPGPAVLVCETSGRLPAPSAAAQLTRVHLTAAVAPSTSQQLWRPPHSSCGVHLTAAVVSTSQQLWCRPHSSCGVDLTAAVVSTSQQLWCPPHSSCGVHLTAAVVSTSQQLWCPPHRSCGVHLTGAVVSTSQQLWRPYYMSFDIPRVGIGVGDLKTRPMSSVSTVPGFSPFLAALTTSFSK